jgi:hypothetical protein
MNWKGFGRKPSCCNRGLSWHLFEGTEEIDETYWIAGVPAEFKTEHFHNANLERYRYANLLSESCILCCNAVWLGGSLTFRRNHEVVLPTSFSALKGKPGKKPREVMRQAETTCLSETPGSIRSARCYNSEYGTFIVPPVRT